MVVQAPAGAVGGGSAGDDQRSGKSVTQPGVVESAGEVGITDRGEQGGLGGVDAVPVVEGETGKVLGASDPGSAVAPRRPSRTGSDIPDARIGDPVRPPDPSDRAVLVLDVPGLGVLASVVPVEDAAQGRVLSRDAVAGAGGEGEQGERSGDAVGQAVVGVPVGELGGAAPVRGEVGPPAGPLPPVVSG